jgi:propionate CoA-transferase
LAQLISADDAARLIQDRWTIACAGFVGAGHAEAVSAALERRFMADGSPRGLTLIYSAGQGDRGRRGVNHFGHAGLTHCIIGGHWRSAPALTALALNEQADAYNLPQGVISQLYRAIAGGKPGVITRTGLHTFVDPRYGGARLNERSPDNRVEHLQLGDEEFLRYLPLPIQCALVRGTTADPQGNITGEHEAFHHEMLAIAQAARNSGGIVIAQVKRLSRHPAYAQAVKLPGILVDYVVVCGEDPLNHAMTFAEYFNPRYVASPSRAPQSDRKPAAAMSPAMSRVTGPVSAPALDARRIIQRRALLELMRSGARVVNLGVGMPAGIGAIAREEGVDSFVLTVEAGPIGGVPADGLSFGAAEFAQAVVDQPAQFDFYDGGGIDMACLGLAEFDLSGSVNVSLFGEGRARIIAGVGGFINITQATRKLVFTGTLTAGGLVVEADQGRLRICREGRHRKLLSAVTHLSFNGPYASRQGTDALYVTERAVFALRDGAIELTEIAPGIDLERDVLSVCPGGVRVSPSLRTMDACIFEPGPMLRPT